MNTKKVSKGFEIFDYEKYIQKYMSKALKEQRAEIIEMLEGMKKEASPEEKWDGKSGTFGAYNQAVEDIIKKLKDK